MKKYVIIIILNIIASLLEVSFFGEILGIGSKIYLVFAMTQALYLLGYKDLAYFSGFSGGIFVDLLGIGVLGKTSFLIILGILLISTARSLLERNRLWLMILFFIYILLWNTAELLLAQTKPAISDFIKSPLLTTLVFYLIYLAYISFINFYTATDYKLSK